MRILIVGAGAIGGYFGGRLIEKGEDVTFLVRDKRRQQLMQNGLVIESIHGNMKFEPKTMVFGEAAEPFELILLATKSYHLHDAIESIRSYAGKNTVILPLLNGIDHLNLLTDSFGEGNVIGGLCLIETTLDEKGKIIQTSPIHELVFGELNGGNTSRIQKLQQAFSGTKASFRISDNILQDLWHKYLFISTLSGVTSIFRSPIGPIREDEFGLRTIKTVLQEASKIMRNHEAPIADSIEDVLLNNLMNLGYTMKSSLQRDMEKGLPTEADHFFGYLLNIARDNDLQTPALDAIYGNLKIYDVNLKSKKLD